MTDFVGVTARTAWRRATFRKLPGLLLLPFLLLLACATDEATGPGLADHVARGPDTPVVIPPDEPIVVGVSVALTGPVAPRGLQYRDAVVVAVERWKAARGSQIHGRDIVVVAEDDGCTEGDVAQKAAARLLRRPGLVGVIGPECSSGTLAALPTYADAGIVVISGSATVSALAEVQPGEGFFFRTAYRNDFQGILIGVYVSQIVGAEYAYLIDNRETYGLDLVDSAEALLLEQGVRISRGSIQQGAKDFSQVAAEVTDANPDVVLFGGFNPEAILLLRQLRDAGWNGLYTAGDAVCGAADCEFLAVLGELAEGSAFSGCSPPMPADFIEEFDAVHGKEPTAAFVTHYADATTILLNAVAAVAEAQPDGSVLFDPKALRDTVAAASLSGGLSGDVVFNADGDRTLAEAPESLEQFARELGLVPCQVKNGAIVGFEAEEQQLAEQQAAE